MRADTLSDEQGRIRAVQRYGVLDSPGETVFDSITSIVKDILGVPICAVSLVDSDRQWFKSIQGLDVRETERSAAFCDHSIREYRPMIVADALTDPRFAENPLVRGDPHIRAYAGAPLTTPDGFNLGSLCIIDREPRDFRSSDVAMLERFAKVVMDQLELRTLAQRDFLTGALSRRAFTYGSCSTIEQLEEHGRQGCLAVMDVDFFKQVNDRHGHAVGDAVLKSIADATRALLQPADLFGRLGGEEFGILFAGVDAAQAAARAEEVRAAVASINEPGLPAITVSIGMSEVRGKSDFDEALQRADAALYAAKQGGRNRCHLDRQQAAKACLLQDEAA